MVWPKWNRAENKKLIRRISSTESRYIIHSESSFKLITAATIILMVTLSACTQTATSSILTPTLAPTLLAAPQLGPTSTSGPPTLTRVPSDPTATIRPLDPVTSQDWIRGPLDAEFSFLVYCDFQSPPCEDYTQAINSLRELRPDQIQVIYRLFPMVVLNDKAGLAAQLALAADDQDAFWPMHDLLYEEQRLWTDLSPEEFLAWAEDAAVKLGLDASQITEDLRNSEYAEDADEAFRRGVHSGLPGTPFVLLNGEWFRAAPTLINLEAAIRLELLGKMQYEHAPPLEIDQSAVYLARIQLETGEIVIQLFPQSAPATVANFIFLAKQGWFDGTIFHRVVPGSFVEGGDPSATGFGGPGYFLRDEIDTAQNFDQPGRVAMANSGPDTNGSRFAITLGSMPDWDGARPIFGQVIEGLSLLSSLGAREPLEDLLTEPALKIIAVVIEEQ
jgi:cyclophilin family peptidyl-prolyl cis-trans isomerase/protein-disulfide isomerase